MTVQNSSVRGGAERAAGAPLLTVEGLDVVFRASRGAATRAVRDVSFTLRRGECLALVGESGSGKSVTARTVLGLAGAGSQVRADRLEFDGTDLGALDEAAWRRIRGRRIGLVLQDALVSLDPLRTVGAEVTETITTHRLADRRGAHGQALALLRKVGVPEPERRSRQYPHQLSGGQRQRVLIATALSGAPDLLIADEPTTALDVTVQAQVLDLLAGLVRDGAALLLISHDLAVVSRLADRIAVMHGGRIVESAPAMDLLAEPRHPYTRALLAAVPAGRPRGTRLSVPVSRGADPAADGCPFAARCALADDRCRTGLPQWSPVAPDGAVPDGSAEDRVLCWKPGATVAGTPLAVPTSRRPITGRSRDVGYPPSVDDPVPADGPLLEVSGVTRLFRLAGGGDFRAVRGVSFDVWAGETLGVVGESGSGKTTLARMVLGLLDPDEGTVRFAGEPWSGVPEKRRRHLRRHLQVVNQDPLGSFDPRWSVRRILTEAVAQAGPGRAWRRARVIELLDQVGLAAALLDRRPLHLSGGQRQRVCIARALATEPRLLVCDEPVSALDVSIQAQILDLLNQLQRDLGLALLFISHDLGVIHHVSDRVLVMKDGEVVETDAVDQLFAAPRHPYTQALLAAVPRVRRAAVVSGFVRDAGVDAYADVDRLP